jgi:hypothetical protein
MPSLKSVNLSKLLIQLLWILLIQGGLSIFLSLVGLMLPTRSNSFFINSIVALDGLQTILRLILYYLVVLVMALVWLHKVHHDLRSLYGSYSITPGEALARFMIPFYNLWGIGNTLTTMASQFKSETLTAANGQSLASFVPFLYATLIFSNFLNRLALQQAFSSNGANPVLLLGTAIVDTALTFVELKIAQFITGAIRSKALNTPPVEGF